MSNGVDIVILAEDERHRMLLRRHLRKRGYTHHKIRDCAWFPAFQTPCLSFVKSEYPRQVESLRNKAHRVTSALIVVVDADDLTIGGRLSELDKLLSSAGQTQRSGTEHIAIVVPRRNIETWMYFLGGEKVDEETDYKPRCRNFDNGTSASQFASATWPLTNLPDDSPASLKYACASELSRLP